MAQGTLTRRQALAAVIGLPALTLGLAVGLWGLTAPSELAGTRWVLVAAEAADGQRVWAPAEAGALTLAFSAAAVVGQTGCGELSGAYTTQVWDRRLTVRGLAAPAGACAPTQAQPAQAYIQALGAATRYERAAGELRVYYGAEQAALRFQRSP